MHHKKFSVLIPVYKKERPDYFDAALNSIYTQTIRPNEVVICADGELTTELETIIDKYQARCANNTKVVRFPVNRGLGLTLYDGLLECSNEIVFRMDADDVAVEDRFEKQLSVMLETGADVVGSNILEYDEKMQKVFGVRNVPEEDEAIRKYAKRRNPINHMSACFKKSKVIEAGSYMDMAGFEDYYLWIRMMRAGHKFYNLQEPLVKVRGGSSMTKRRGGRSYAKSVIRFENKICDLDFISRLDCVGNIAIRTTASLVPDNVRSLLYGKALRKRCS